MQRKYAKKGLVVVTVSFDDPTDKEIRAEIEKFLKKREASFTNLILKDDPATLYKTLAIPGPPCLYLFNRDNRFVKKMAGQDQIDFKVIDAEIARLLADGS